MKKIRRENQHYDAWLHWDITAKCNLDCEYCFGKITDPKIKVNPINHDVLLRTLNSTGKIFRISFTGGEPTLVPNFIEACEAITKDHFVSFNTNLISRNFQEFVKKINPERVLHIHASLHFDELTSKNLINRFIENYHKLNNNGFNIYAEAVAYPASTEIVEKSRREMSKHSISFNFAPFYGNYNDKRYPGSYTKEELEIFELREETQNMYKQKGELCNAGYNAAVVFSNGDVYPCHQIKEKIGNVYKEINFINEIINCPSKNCGCPLNKYDEYLFEKSLKNTQTTNVI